MALQKEGKDTTEIAVIIELQNQEGLGKPLLCTLVQDSGEVYLLIYIKVY
jgi:hypothetical protein